VADERAFDWFGEQWVVFVGFAVAWRIVGDAWTDGPVFCGAGTMVAFARITEEKVAFTRCRGLIG